MRHFFIALQLMGIVSNWAASAMADGRITADEALRLVMQIAALLGLPTEFDVNRGNPFVLADKADG